MGGLGSGGWGKKKHRRTVESCWVLDVKDLSARGCLQPGLFSTCRWLDGNGGIFSISLRYEAGRNLYLSWRSHINGDGEQREVTEIIPIVYAPCRYGGTRPYFLCPGDTAAGCGRRVFKLYLVRRHFLCRQCSQLVYASKSEQPWRQAFRRANKLRQRLAIVGASVPESPKPCGCAPMHACWRKHLEAETRATEAGTARLQRLLAWIESRRKPLFTLD
jgi:hypothetical protein